MFVRCLQHSGLSELLLLSVCKLVVDVVADLLDKPGGAVSVLAGGCVPGWSPEVAVVLWRRVLGCLGNVNKIRDAGIHEQVYEFLCDLVSTLVKVRIPSVLALY